MNRFYSILLGFVNRRSGVRSPHPAPDNPNKNNDVLETLQHKRCFETGTKGARGRHKKAQKKAHSAVNRFFCSSDVLGARQ